jgi:hypothetical protein
LAADPGENTMTDNQLRRGIAKPVKALDFDSSIRRFESFFPCHSLLSSYDLRTQRAATARLMQSGLAAFYLALQGV